MTEAASQDPVVLDASPGGVAVVRLNRPEKHNAFNADIIARLSDIFETLRAADRVRCILIRGSGKSFSAGADLEWMQAAAHYTFEENEQDARALAEMLHKLHSLPQMTIAMVNGWCFGGAFTPVVSCDLAFAADEAQFGLSEINWGIIPAGGVPRALAEVMSYRNALYYIMTGETFNGQKAAEMGLVNESVPREKLRERTLEVAGSLLEKSPIVVGAAKIAFIRSYNGL